MKLGPLSADHRTECNRLYSPTCKLPLNLQEHSHRIPILCSTTAHPTSRYFLPRIQVPRSSNQESPIQRNSEDKVQETDDHDKESSRDVGRVRENRVEVTEKEKEGDDSANENEE